MTCGIVSTFCEITWHICLDTHVRAGYGRGLRYASEEDSHKEGRYCESRLHVDTLARWQQREESSRPAEQWSERVSRSKGPCEVPLVVAEGVAVAGELEDGIKGAG